MIFSLVGLRAAYTQRQAEAKLYPAIFPLFFCFRAMIVAQSLGTVSGTALAVEAAYALALVFYFMVRCAISRPLGLFMSPVFSA